jgi:hypothetical protein
MRGEGQRAASATQVMNRRGIEFSRMQARPGLWKWRFQIGETVTGGRTEAKLMGLAVPGSTAN